MCPWPLLCNCGSLRRRLPVHGVPRVGPPLVQSGLQPWGLGRAPLVAPRAASGMGARRGVSA
eukprot:1446299-Pyramimonas_sp.AAC.1